MRTSRQFFGRWGVVIAVLWAGVSAGLGATATNSPTGTLPLSPATLTILRGHWFPGLLQFAQRPSDEESAALLAALHRFASRTDRDDFSALNEFLEKYPEGAWTPSLTVCVAVEYFRQSQYSKAVALWESLWNRRRTIPAEGQVSVTKAGGHLIEAYARLGRTDSIRALLPELETRCASPEDGEHLLGAREGLWSMEHRPELSFRCGPLALDRIRAFGHRTNLMHPLIFNSKSTTNGISLTELAQLARDLGMNYQMAFRSTGAPVLLPAVVHWKLGHYAALLAERGGLLHAQDPTFWDNTWLSKRTLDGEASGYFLVPPGPLPQGWRTVGDEEGRVIFGKGPTRSSDPDRTTPMDRQAKCNQRKAMADWNCHLMLVSQRLEDTPLGYHPPVGPDIDYRVSFNQRRNARYERLAEWTDNWTGLLYQDPFNIFNHVLLYLDGGWLTFEPDFENTNVFHGQWQNPGTLVRVNTNRFEWHLPDGGSRIYAYVPAYFATNSIVSSVLYLSGVADAAGNTVTLGYDTLDRLTTLTDAIGQVTRLFYEQPDPGLPSVPGCRTMDSCFYAPSYDYPYLVTRVTDPFGRSARFNYGLELITRYCSGGFCVVYSYSHSLSNIIDVAGLESRFTWTNAFGIRYADSLTTPYGTTRFNWQTPAARTVYLEVTHPNGEKERIEYAESAVAAIDYLNIPFAELFSEVPVGIPIYNRYLSFRNTFYWDRAAYAMGYATNDYSKARIYHWLHQDNITACAGTLESYKAPLEGRVWFAYPGQPLTIQGVPLATVPGTSDKPSYVGRTLDDGRTQIWRYERNDADNVTRSIDPAGRTLSYSYASNGIDLTEVRQTRGGQDELLFTATFNAQHLPLTVAGADRQTNRFTYNPRGQVLTFANAKGDTTEFTYDANGFLTAIDGPPAGVQNRTTFTYDAFGRARTIMDPDGYVLTVDYDNLDRLTRITYPDATFDQIDYDRLEPGLLRDRLGRQTRYTYDSLRRIAEVQDALGQVTRFDWCGCGGLRAIIDPLGRTTRWETDGQGRIVAKEYPDGARLTYEYERRTSRLKRIRDEKDQITEFKYGIDDYLLERRYVNTLIPTPALKFTYDPDFPRLTSMEDGNGLTRFTYHPINNSLFSGAGRLASVDGPWANDTVTYAYDELGRVQRRAIEGVAVTWAYDAVGRLIGLTNALGSFVYAWQGASERLSSVRYPNNQQTEYAYYPNLRDQRLQRITHRRPDHSILSEFTYAFDAEGRITNWTQFQGGALTGWAAGYDAASRLASVNEAGPASARVFAFGYDAANNLTSSQVNAERHDFGPNVVNQVAVLGNAPPSIGALEWDAEQRLVGISNGTHRTEFSYDGFDRRTRIVEKENGVVTSDRRYLWCGADLCEERDATGGTVLTRFSSFGAKVEVAGSNPVGTYFYTRDHLDSVRELTDSGGAVRAVFAYSPLGEAAKLAGDLEPGYGFGGYQTHRPSGLGLALYRALDPRLGRWLSRDPQGERGGLNLYAYAGNDPLNYDDPLGLEPRAAELTQGLQGQRQAQAAMDAYGNAKKVGKVVESVVEKGIKKTATDKIKSELEKRRDKAVKEIAPGAQEEQERLLREAEKTGREAVDPFGKVLRNAANGINDGLSGCGNPTLSPKPTPTPEAPQEKGWLDSIVDFFTSSSSSDAPTPPPPTPIQPKPLFNTKDRAQAAGGF